MGAASGTQPTRAFIVVAVTATVLGALPASVGPASASHAKDGDPISEVPELFPDGASFGTLSDHTDSTEPNGKYGPCDGEGGSVYRITATLGTRVDLVVQDDLGGRSLCQVVLYRQHYVAATLPGFYEFPDLQNYAAGETGCPFDYSICQMTWTIPENDTYYLAFWPRYSFSVPEKHSIFKFSVQVRQPTSAGLKIGGHLGKIGGCFRERKGGSFSGIAVVSPSSSGEVKFRLERRIATTGEWKLVNTFVRSLSKSSAKLNVRLFRVTRYRLRAEYLGDDGHAPSTSGWLCLRIPPPRQ